jgi:hypothetical protein
MHVIVVVVNIRPISGEALLQAPCVVNATNCPVGPPKWHRLCGPSFHANSVERTEGAPTLKMQRFEERLPFSSKVAPTRCPEELFIPIESAAGLILQEEHMRSMRAMSQNEAML